MKDTACSLIAEDHYSIVLSKVVLCEITAIVESQLAHLPVRKLHPTRWNGHNAGSDLVPKTGIRFRTHSTNDWHLVANSFNVSLFILNFLASSLATRLQTCLSRPKHDDVVSHVQEGVQNAATQALAVSEQEDNRRQSPHDAEHGQRRAQSIAEKRLPALRDELFQEHRFLQDLNVARASLHIHRHTTPAHSPPNLFASDLSLYRHRVIDRDRP